MRTPRSLMEWTGRIRDPKTFISKSVVLLERHCRRFVSYICLYSTIFSWSACSNILETKDKLEIGRYGYPNRKGRALPSCELEWQRHTSGMLEMNQWSVKCWTVLTINGYSSFAYFLIIKVGAGSSSQNLQAAELIKRLTAATSKSLKSPSLVQQGGPSNVGRGEAAVAERNRSSLAWKASENRSAPSSLELCYHIKIIHSLAMFLEDISAISVEFSCSLRELQVVPQKIHWLLVSFILPVIWLLERRIWRFSSQVSLPAFLLLFRDLSK